jgi:hypothetical protein
MIYVPFPARARKFRCWFWASENQQQQNTGDDREAAGYF